MAVSESPWWWSPDAVRGPTCAWPIQTRCDPTVRAEIASSRIGRDPNTDPYPRMGAGMALLALDTVLQRWQPGDDEQHLAELMDQAFAVVAPALDAPAASHRAESHRR